MGLAEIHSCRRLLKSDIIFREAEDAMIVCLCEGLNDRKLREAIREGACDVRKLARTTRAGTHCGSCACDLKRLVAEEQAEDERQLLAAK